MKSQLYINHSFHYILTIVSSELVVDCAQDMFLLASMGPPGGGRTQISSRLQSRFNLINITFPSVTSTTLCNSAQKNTFKIGLKAKVKAFHTSLN